MPTFIDESGDTGHHKSSRPYFRIAAIWIPTEAEAEGFRESVRRLRRRLNLKADFEFKYFLTRKRADLRTAFFQLALRHQFQFGVCGIDKTQGQWRTASKDFQHWATATPVAVDLRPAYHRTEKQQANRPLHEPILVDNNQDAGFLAAVERAFCGLRSNLHPHAPMVRVPRFRGSKPEEVLQLADMVCGAAGDLLEGNSTWYNWIKERCIGITQWPCQPIVIYP